MNNRFGKIRRGFLVLWTGTAMIYSHGQGEAQTTENSGAKKIDFTWDIQPILVNHCYECHGPDVQEADLRLDQRASVFDRESPVVEAGDPSASLLYQRVTADDPSDRMPKDADPLPEERIDRIARWIRQGADWPEGAAHWAFRTPRRPDLPAVENEEWVENPIDYFVLNRLETEGLVPSPEADKETLIRRLSLDLTGLPPEPEEVDAFLADVSPDAYENLVEDLLASPHYGERWAQWWLDLARYGDTGGYDHDRPRDIWLYRDYVINAFNRDKPFDRFALEQLAGDLLPDPGDEELIATGFIRNSPEPQYDFDKLIDRVDTVGTAFMGLTFECAQCHDHKFDPISQKEFYQMFSLFKNTDEKEIEARSPLNGRQAETLAVTDKEEYEQAHIAIGGSFLNPGEPVDPGAPASFHPLPEGGVTNRLQLARWLVDDRNPLMGRVTVNRHWEAFFGRGIVRTSEDLGTRTELPTHPKLLDWLALEFRENHWSFKSLHRLIVNSATYRQSSRMTSRSARLDPQNRLLARGPRFRVPAEMVRDIALAASGALEEELGGPSVFPPQPDGITENRFRGAYDWEESEGADRYRRGLYTFWKRAALYPSFELFDAPRRETSCVRRNRSNTPLQALVLLNDPAYVELAIHLGGRMLDSGFSEPTEQITYGFRRVLTRRPNDAELERLLSFYRDERSRFQSDPAAARALLSMAADDELEALPETRVIDWAALALTGNALLSLDETITKQ